MDVTEITPDYSAAAQITVADVAGVRVVAGIVRRVGGVVATVIVNPSLDATGDRGWCRGCTAAAASPGV